MDNFEGGMTMTQSVTNTQATTQPVSAPVTHEVVLTPETDVEVRDTQPEVQPKVHKTENEPVLANRLLEDAKTEGIDSVFQNLASGKYFQKDTVSPTEIEEGIGEESDFAEELATENGEEEIKEPTFSEKIADVSAYVKGEVAQDPLFKQKMGEVMLEAEEKGITLDPKEVRSEAFERYMEEKNLGEAKLSLEDKIVTVEEQFANILQENSDLKKELGEFKSLVKQQSETMSTMAQALLELAKKLHEKEEDEESKMSLLEILIKLVGMLMQEFAKYEQQGRTAEQPSHLNNDKNSISKVSVELPKIFNRGDKGESKVKSEPEITQIPQPLVAQAT